MAIDTAFVLAAGRGERLSPLTDALPKPLLPLAGKPAVCHVFDSLIAAGVGRIILNVHHLAGKFPEVLGGEYRGVKIEYVKEPELLDTGGGIKNILSRIDTSKPLIVHNGDIFFDAPLSDFAGAAESLFRKDKKISAALCLRREGKLKNVAVRSGKVVDMRFTTGETGDAVAQYAGVFAAFPPLFPLLEKNPKSSFPIVDTFVESIKSDIGSVAGIFEDRGLWRDIGTPESYADLNSSFGDKGDFYRIAKLKCLGFHADAFVPIAKGASTREFFSFKDRSRRGRKLVACFYSKEKLEDSFYADIASYLYSQGISVPEVLFHDASERIIVMESAGDLDLSSLSGKLRSEAYLQTARIARDLHTRVTHNFLSADSPPIPLNPPFDEELYAWERRYFLEECVLGRFGIACPGVSDSEFAEISSTLLGGEQCLVHRDLQSQNVMISETGKASLIDFQGMRMGCGMYDVASLIFDPYAELSECERSGILEAYFGREASKRERRALYIAACQRLMQALGAYGFLSIKKGMPLYGKYFKPALVRLCFCASKSGLCGLSSLAERCLKIL